MDEQFISVKTWQGYVMVSASLLPSSTEEKTRIYPERQSCKCTLHCQNGSNSHAVQAPSRRPPVPNFWNHKVYSDNYGEMSSALDMEISRACHNPAMPTLASEANQTSEQTYPHWIMNNDAWEIDSPLDSDDSTSVSSPPYFSTSTLSTPPMPLLQHNYLLEDIRQVQDMGMEQASRRAFTVQLEQPAKRRRLSPGVAVMGGL